MPSDPPAPGVAPEVLSSALLADVLDALGHRHSALPIDVRPLCPEWKLWGPAATLTAVAVDAEPARPYAVELECIDHLSAGCVLVATTNGDRGSALWGELLTTACRARGVHGVVLDGLTRDAARITALNFPVFAAGFCPLDSKGRLDAVAYNQPIRVGAVVVRPGDWVYGDIDGVVVVPHEQAEAAITKAWEKATGENRVREELAKGRSVREVFAEYGIL
jgi:regulator of RNase E activity RraA